MKKSESISTLEEALEQESHKSPRRDSKVEEQLLRRSLSEELPTLDVSSDIPKTSPVLARLKNRIRLSSAFRSLRGTSSSSGKKSSSSKPTDKEEGFKSDEADKAQTTPKVKKKKLKLSKFSFSKKHKVAPRQTPLEEPLVTSSTQTSDTLKRWVQQTSEPRSLSPVNLSEVKQIASDERSESDSVKRDKIRTIQITISGKKIEDNKFRVKSATSPDYLPPNIITERRSEARRKPQQSAQTTATVADNQRENAKLKITESTRDTPPRERAPSRPQGSPTSLRGSPLPSRTGISGSVSGSNDTNLTLHRVTVVERTPPLSPRSDDGGRRGAIRRNARLQRQNSREEFFDAEVQLRRDTNLDRGRRFPRPSNLETSPQSTRKQEQLPHSLSSSPLSGNNLQNPNLSGSIADRPKNTVRTLSPQLSRDYRRPTPPRIVSSEEKSPEKSQKLRFSASPPLRARQITVIHKSPPKESLDVSPVDSTKSSASQSPVSDAGSVGRRRRIHYIDQATFYTDEEREILEGKREALGYLSGISEFSLESDFSVDATMPAFGDLTMDPEGPPIITASQEKREHLYKILVIGELGTGKTSFIKRYVHQFFSQSYRATIGVDFALKVLHWDQNTIIRLQLWDIAGQERFGNMTRVYYKEAVGAFIVFDVTRNATFDAVIKWKQDLDSKVQLPDGSSIPCILLANKCDQQKQGIVTTPEKMDEYVQENGFAGWFETSAKENVNIEEAARALVNKILMNDKLVNSGDMMDNEKFALAGGSTAGTAQSTSQAKKSTCSC